MPKNTRPAEYPPKNLMVLGLFSIAERSLA